MNPDYRLTDDERGWLHNRLHELVRTVWHTMSHELTPGNPLTAFVVSYLRDELANRPKDLPATFARP